MYVKDVLDNWQRSASERRTVKQYCVRLPVHDAAKLAALAQMYPGRSEQDIITDLLSAALDELEASFPYVEGDYVVAEDEQGDPIYEDAGLTPRFRALTEQYLSAMDKKTGTGSE